MDAWIQVVVGTTKQKIASIERAKITVPPRNPCLDRAKKFDKIGNAGTMYRVVMVQSVDTLKQGLARPENAA